MNHSIKLPTRRAVVLPIRYNNNIIIIIGHRSQMPLFIIHRETTILFMCIPSVSFHLQAFRYKNNKNKKQKKAFSALHSPNIPDGIILGKHVEYAYNIIISPGLISNRYIYTYFRPRDAYIYTRESFSPEPRTAARYACFVCITVIPR